MRYNGRTRLYGMLVLLWLCCMRLRASQQTSKLADTLEVRLLCEYVLTEPIICHQETMSVRAWLRKCGYRDWHHLASKLGDHNTRELKQAEGVDLPERYLALLYHLSLQLQREPRTVCFRTLLLHTLQHDKLDTSLSELLKMAVYFNTIDCSSTDRAQAIEDALREMGEEHKSAKPNRHYMITRLKHIVYRLVEEIVLSNCESTFDTGLYSKVLVDLPRFFALTLLDQQHYYQQGYHMYLDYISAIFCLVALRFDPKQLAPCATYIQRAMPYKEVPRIVRHILPDYSDEQSVMYHEATQKSQQLYRAMLLAHITATLQDPPCYYALLAVWTTFHTTAASDTVLWRDLITSWGKLRAAQHSPIVHDCWLKARDKHGKPLALAYKEMEAYGLPALVQKYRLYQRPSYIHWMLTHWLAGQDTRTPSQNAHTLYQLYNIYMQHNPNVYLSDTHIAAYATIVIQHPKLDDLQPTLYIDTLGAFMRPGFMQRNQEIASLLLRTLLEELLYSYRWGDIPKDKALRVRCLLRIVASSIDDLCTSSKYRGTINALYNMLYTRRDTQTLSRYKARRYSILTDRYPSIYVFVCLSAQQEQTLQRKMIAHTQHLIDTTHNDALYQHMAGWEALQMITKLHEIEQLYFAVQGTRCFTKFHATIYERMACHDWVRERYITYCDSMGIYIPMDKLIDWSKSLAQKRQTYLATVAGFAYMQHMPLHVCWGAMREQEQVAFFADQPGVCLSPIVLYLPTVQEHTRLFKAIFPDTYPDTADICNRIRKRNIGLIRGYMYRYVDRNIYYVRLVENSIAAYYQ